MKLLLFTDSHYCQKALTCRNRRPTLSYGKVKEMLAAVTDADLLICLGDFIDDGGDHDANVAHTRALMALIRRAGIPFYTLMGNHDCHAFSRAEFASLTDGAVPPFVHRVGGKALIFLDAGYSDDGNIYAPGKIDWKNSYLPFGQLEQLADTLDRLATYGKSKVAFVIGGSLGLSDEVMKRSNEALSFSKMTFPHQLMRLILVEQIYRAFRINRGEPYHK